MAHRCLNLAQNTSRGKLWANCLRSEQSCELRTQSGKLRTQLQENSRLKTTVLGDTQSRVNSARNSGHSLRFCSPPRAMKSHIGNMCRVRCVLCSNRYEQCDVFTAWLSGLSCKCETKQIRAIVLSENITISQDIIHTTLHTGQVN